MTNGDPLGTGSLATVGGVLNPGYITPTPTPLAKLPSLNIEMVENGYIIYVGVTRGAMSERWVATSFDELTNVIKEIATKARLCGNNPA